LRQREDTILKHNDEMQVEMSKLFNDKFKNEQKIQEIMNEGERYRKSMNEL
jgi:hypothetical protein